MERVVERPVRTSSSSSSGGSALTSHAAQAAVVMFILSLAGFGLTVGAMFIRRSPLTFAGVIMGSGIIFVVVAGMLSNWFRKYGRRRSRHGNLARGQGLAMFAFISWLLNGAMFLVHFGLTAARWKGF